MQNTFTIDADIKKTSYFNQPTVTQNDDITFIINITDDGQAFDLASVATVSLANTKPDANVVVTAGSTTGTNQVTFVLGTNETSVSGRVDAVVQLYDANDRVSTLSFSYAVKVDPTGSGYVPSTDEQTLIEVVLNDGPLRIQEAIDAGVYANLQGDYALAQGDYALDQGDIAATESDNLSVLKTDVQVATSNAETATQSAQDVADNTTYIEEWSSITPYSKNNIVRFNGSSFMSLQSVNLNNAPAPIVDTLYWALMARRGADGTGAVSTINSVLPDVDGDVVLTASEVGAIPTSEKGVASGVAELNIDGKVIDASGNLVADSSGDMLTSIYDPNFVDGNAFDADNHASGITNKVYTAIEKTKLSTITEGAEVNVQSDWDATTGDAVILNKPAIGGGGGGVASARFVIGTSTAGWTADDCDYLCDGVADDIEINAAITALPANSGEILILDGTYNITAAILIESRNNVSIRGNGNATILKRMYDSMYVPSVAPDLGVITLYTASYCSIKDLQIDGNKATYSYKDNNAIYLSQSSNNNVITGSHCYNNGYGIRISKSSNNVTTGNLCSYNDYGIQLYQSKKSVITGNHCYDNGYGIYLSASNNNVITGNLFIRGVGQPQDYYTSQYTILLSSFGNNYNLISSNQCMGKAVVIEGGTSNTEVNNKFA